MANQDKYSNRLIEIRKKIGWSRQMLADFSGVAKSTIQSFENGSNDINIYYMLLIAEALGVDIEEIVKLK